MLLLFIETSCINTLKSTPTKSIIEIPYSNMLYQNIDNPINIAVNRFDNSDIKLTTYNGFIEGTNGQYTIHPTKIGLVTISIFAKVLLPI